MTIADPLLTFLAPQMLLHIPDKLELTPYVAIAHTVGFRVRKLMIELREGSAEWIGERDE